MKIELTHFQAFKLSEEFARLVMHQVLEQRLAMIGLMSSGVCSEFREMQEAIRSIPDGSERSLFISNLRYHFQTLRREKGSQIRGRDYVAAVRAHDRKRELAEAVS